MKTILVVEDQPVMRSKTVTILKMEGFEVIEAGNGAEGIRLAQEELPDLILCDIMMPDQDGYAVLQAVRLNRATATTPFIFLTAKGEKMDLRAGMNLGADDYLVKPTPRVDLLEAIHARFERQRLNEEHLRSAQAWVNRSDRRAIARELHNWSPARSASHNGAAWRRALVDRPTEGYRTPPTRRGLVPTGESFVA